MQLTKNATGFAKHQRLSVGYSISMLFYSILFINKNLNTAFLEFQPAKTKTGQNRTKQLKQKLVTVLIIGTNILKKGLSRRH